MKAQHIRTIVILFASIALVAIVTWFAPALSAASSNMLFRLRGEIAPPPDLVILAVDDKSLQRIGRWPWARSIVAEALDKITVAGPKAVGLDIIYAETSTADDDNRLAEAIRHNGRVVLPAQLIESETRAADQPAATSWLRPLPSIASGAAATGHAHVSPDVDGILRSIQLSKADDRADRLWAFGLEVIRLAEGIQPRDFSEETGTLRYGPYRISLRDETEPASIPGVSIIRSNEMLINYIGPAGSFRSYSFSDVLDNQLPPDALNGKIVLIGAVAQSLGDTRVSPFMHYGANDRQAGQEMPGVEIHANIINTIRGRTWLRPLSDQTSFALALVVILSAALVINLFDGWRQILSLALILIAITLGSFFAFVYYHIMPPLAGMLTGFLVAVPLLLNRTLSASQQLDVKLAALAKTQKGFLLDDEASVEEKRSWLDLPHNLGWKLRAVDDTYTRLIARMSFMDRVLSSMGEGVLVAETSGRIVFSNREAAQVFNLAPEDIIGASFADSFVERGIFEELELRAAINQVAAGGVLQKEFKLQLGESRYFLLHLSAIVARPAAPDSVSASLTASQTRNGIIGMVALISDITKRVELDQIKAETLQLVSHELRTPLTSIQGLSDVLLKFPVQAAEAREMIDTIHSEAVRLRETINRYLDIARLESGVEPLKLLPFKAKELIAACVRSLTPLAAEREIRISQHVDSSIPPLNVDAQLISQAINNLLSNAIKYSEVGSEVAVEASSAGGDLLIAVRDQGLGIPLGDQERIFEKFYRLERDAASGIVGTGLGLPLVREIVEKHGGRVTVVSDPSKGSTFTIHLPIRSAPPAVESE